MAKEDEPMTRMTKQFGADDHVTVREFGAVVRAAVQLSTGEWRYVIEFDDTPGAAVLASGWQLKLRAGGRCEGCGHIWSEHSQPDPYEQSMGHESPSLSCVANVGLGLWCGCREHRV